MYPSISLLIDMFIAIGGPLHWDFHSFRNHTYCVNLHCFYNINWTHLQLRPERVVLLDWFHCKDKNCKQRTTFNYFYTIIGICQKLNLLVLNNFDKISDTYPDMLRTEEKLSVQVGFLDEIIVSNGDKSLAAYTHQGIVLQHLTPYCTTSNLYSKRYTFNLELNISFAPPK